MNRLDILTRRQEIEKELKGIRKREEILEDELKALQKECKHEITVTTRSDLQPKDVQHSYIKPKTYCILCGMCINPRRHYSND